MKSYNATFWFDNLDNYMGTEDQAAMSVVMQSDSYSHAYLLAQRFAKVMDADRFDLDEKG